MVHSFNVELAKKYGLVESILLANFEFWIAKNQANGENFYEGRYWTFNSVKAFEELFPYLSTRNIRTALEHLIKEDVLITGNFNQKSYDRTLWYAFSDRYLAICQNEQMDLSKLTNGFVKMSKPIPDIKQDNNKTNNTNVLLAKEKFSFEKHTNKENINHILQDKKYEKMRQEFRQALIDWCEYKDQRKPKNKHHYAEMGLRKTLTQTINYATKYGMTPVINQINKAIASSWDGMNLDMLDKKENKYVRY